MRIFLLVFGMLFAVGIVAAAAYYSRDIITEKISIYRFTQDLKALQLIKNREHKATNCNQNSNPDNVLDGFQLRFVSDTDYIIESVCLYPVADQAVLKTGKLYGELKRVYGSGIRLDKNGALTGEAWVQLQFKNKTFYAGIFNQNPEISTQKPDTTIGGDSPAVANCTDWGFVCCIKSQGEGSGLQVPALDCPHTCYQQCLRNPSVVFFNTNPLINGANRTLLLSGRSTTVQFGYEIQDDKDVVKRVVIDFGDGKQAQTSELSMDSIQHTYTCAKSQCVFNTNITISGDEPIALTDSSTNNIKIVMGP